MQEYDWHDMMNYMQDIRVFCSLNVKRAKKDGITSAQELDFLSRIALSNVPMTPHDLSLAMSLNKSAISRLIIHLEKKGFLQKVQSPTDHRSYTLMLTENGHIELNQTYQYYLGPVYALRKSLGEEKFIELTKLINEANTLLQSKEDF